MFASAVAGAVLAVLRQTNADGIDRRPSVLCLQQGVTIMSGPTSDDIRAAVGALGKWSEERLLELVRCPSLQGAEKSAQDVVQRILDQELGMKVDRWALDEEALKNLRGFSPVAWAIDKSECVVGTYDAVDPSARSVGAAALGTLAQMHCRSLIINGHVDVVPVDPPHLWTVAPFSPYVKDGWLYGRGSGDMKGGIIAAMAAVLALRKLGYRPAGRLHFETVPEEENTGNGALSCCARGYTADACIIPEPFNDCMSVAQVGVMWMSVHLDGKPAHVLDTTAGLSAIQVSHRPRGEFVTARHQRAFVRSAGRVLHFRKAARAGSRHER